MIESSTYAYAHTYLGGDDLQGLWAKVGRRDLHNVALVQHAGVRHRCLGGEAAQRLLLLAHTLRSIVIQPRGGKGEKARRTAAVSLDGETGLWLKLGKRKHMEFVEQCLELREVLLIV